MAHTINRGWFMLDADASPGFQPASRDGGMALVEGTAIIYWHQTGTTWNKIDLSTLAGADGNNYVIARGDAIAAGVVLIVCKVLFVEYTGVTAVGATTGAGVKAFIVHWSRATS